MALPPEQLAKIEAAKELSQQRQLEQTREMLDTQDVGYTSKLFVQSIFPYKKTDSRERIIHAGDDTVSIMSANGLPYGKYPRLIMAYIITRAVENAGRLRDGKINLDEAVRIPLGHSMSHFLEAIGISVRPNGGKRGNITILREQIKRIASSIITVQRDNGIHAQGRNTAILSQWNLWFDTRDPNQSSVMESELVLTPEFFSYVVESPIPIDLNILRKLERPRAMDIYIWLTLKQFWLVQSNRDAYTFTWDMITENFANKPVDTSVKRRDFRNEIKKAIHDVVTVWPDSGIKSDLEGVTVSRMAPSIEIKRARSQRN